MSFPIGNPNANSKKYPFPVTPFSTRNSNRISAFFRLRNIENDLNDFATHIQTHEANEFTTEVLTQTVSFTASESVKTITFASSAITKTGKSPIAIFAVDTNNNDVDIVGFNLNGDSATVTLRHFGNSLAAKGIVTNVAYASGTAGALTVTKAQGTAANITLTLEVLYRRNWTNYAEKQ